MKRAIILILSGTILCLCLVSGLTGCSNKELLDPKDPVTLTMWHVFGSQTDSPMNGMVDEFNRTVGKDKGVIINVTSVSNSTDIHTALLAAARGEAGAGSLPDLFFCYPETARFIGADRIVDWNDLFTTSELALYVPAFLEEGTVDGKLLVFPVAKSSEALFINATIFDRFSADTGVTYDSLATWDGLLDAAAKYHTWSGGKSFLKLDSLINYFQVNTTALGGHAFTGDKLNFGDPVFEALWQAFAGAAISGHLYIDENYATACMMTGDIAAAICSTASILYFQDTVTYRDNTTEPLALVALPYPVKRGGTKTVMQQGVGLVAAVKGDAKKEAAALLLTKWITEGETNLRFVTQAGYMPVQTTAFEAIKDFSFDSSSYRSLYEAMDAMRSEYEFFITPVIEGYNALIRNFNISSSDILKGCIDRYLSGESTHSELVAESYEAIRRIMG